MTDITENVKLKMLTSLCKSLGVTTNESTSVSSAITDILLSTFSVNLRSGKTLIEKPKSPISERILALLNPTFFHYPKPAQTLAKGQPIEHELIIDENEKFNLSPIVNDKLDKDILFSTIQETKLVGGKIEYLAYGNRIFNIFNDKQRTEIAKSTKHIDYSTFWIGLSLDDIITPLNGVSFHFDLKNKAQSPLFYKNLHQSVWSINQFKLSMRSGFYEDLRNKSQPKNIHDSNVQKIFSNVANYYREQFITIKSTNKRNPVIKAKLPQLFETVFDPVSLHLINENIIWIEVKFLEIMKEEIFDNLDCQLNVFPVVNLEKHRSRLTTNSHLAVFSIEDNHSFIGVSTIKENIRQPNMIESDSAIDLLNSNEIKIDIRQQPAVNKKLFSQQLSTIIALLKDEKTFLSKSNIGESYEKSTALDQLIDQLEQEISIDIKQENKTYLVVNSEKKSHKLLLEYYTTLGEYANRLPANTSLQSVNKNVFKNNEIKTLNPTYGGRLKLNNSEKLDLFRSHILSKNKINSVEDLRAFSESHLGNKAQSVLIKKGVSEQLSVHKGYAQTIDIHISPSEENINEEEWGHICKDLLLYLQSKPSNPYPYRFFINGAECLNIAG